MGNVILLVVSFLCNPLALLLHVACGQSKTFAQCLQALPCTRTRFPCVHWRLILCSWVLPFQPRKSSSLHTQRYSVPRKNSLPLAHTSPLSAIFALHRMFSL